MPGLQVEVVTAERMVFTADADMVVAPGSQGELGILPHHAPLLTTLRPGVLRVKIGRDETALAVGGGFLEVRDNRVLVLADTAERAEEIDIERARAAEDRAARLLQTREEAPNLAQAAAALQRSRVRLRVARRHRNEEVQR